MGEKTAGVGHFAIPTAPAAGTSCTSGAANVFTTTYVALSAAAPAALFITGIHVEKAAASAATYAVIQLATGAAGSETIVGQYLVPLSTGSTVALGYRPIYPFIPVANGVRIACKTADSVGAQVSLITLECINQSNVVDDGVAVGTVTTVTNQLTAAQIATGVWQDATAGDFTAASSIGKSLYTSGAVPGAANGLQIAGANAATTYASLTSTGAFTVNGVSSVSQTGDSFARIGAAGAGLTALGDTRIANLDATVSSRSTYAGGDTSGTTTLLARLTALRAGNLDNLDAAVSTRSAYAGGDTAGVTTLLGRLTATRATNLDNLDAAISTRLPTSSYSTPPTAVAIRTEIDANSVGLAAIFARTDVATSSRAAAGDAMALTVAERASVADALLARNVSGGSSAGRTVKQALAVLRNKVEVVAGVLTVYDTDDTTVLFTAAVTTTAGNPISAIDPA